MSTDPPYEALRRLLDAYYGDRPESMEVAVAAQKIEAWLDAARGEQRATDMEKALNVIEAVAYEGTAGVIPKTEALRAIQADCSAALSAREEAL